MSGQANGQSRVSGTHTLTHRRTRLLFLSVSPGFSHVGFLHQGPPQGPLATLGLTNPGFNTERKSLYSLGSNLRNPREGFWLAEQRLWAQEEGTWVRKERRIWTHKPRCVPQCLSSCLSPWLPLLPATMCCPWSLEVLSTPLASVSLLLIFLLCTLQSHSGPSTSWKISLEGYDEIIISQSPRSYPILLTSLQDLCRYLPPAALGSSPILYLRKCTLHPPSDCSLSVLSTLLHKAIP